ncbi:hypothetical protein NPIL_536811 [Nephila pilipes]|uniref:Secreted protein n=1 Tax=Nephila pilipes TaxID=299642 RepID=A0A8X6MVK4_NEPPI|nr:hypothetical protein NPIL_536811 [Nephila pilipes]
MVGYFFCLTYLFLLQGYVLSSPSDDSKSLIGKLLALRQPIHKSGEEQSLIHRRMKRQKNNFSTLGVSYKFCEMFHCVPEETKNPKKSTKCKNGHKYDKRSKKCRKLF